MLHCTVCGRRLGLREVARNLFHRRDAWYPFKSMSGDRREFPVRCLCSGCAHRAAEHRRDEPGAAPRGARGGSVP